MTGNRAMFPFSVPSSNVYRRSAGCVSRRFVLRISLQLFKEVFSEYITGEPAVSRNLLVLHKS